MLLVVLSLIAFIVFLANIADVTSDAEQRAKRRGRAWASGLLTLGSAALAVLILLAARAGSG
jgi:4-hydroxybenzoate polyprenyltransferase